MTKLLGGGANLTLESMVRLAEALGCSISTHLTQAGFSPRWVDISDATETRRIEAKPAKADYQPIFTEENYDAITAAA